MIIVALSCGRCSSRVTAEVRKLQDAFPSPPHKWRTAEGDTLARATGLPIQTVSLAALERAKVQTVIIPRGVRSKLAEGLVERGAKLCKVG